MLVLGIDTATWTAAAGLVRDGAVVADAAVPDARTHVATLPRLVERVLADAGVGADAVQAVAVSIGPGSFTGLRIGLSFAKGLAYAGALPLVAVPTLAALAAVAPAAPGDLVCAALDARRHECWTATFRRTAGGLEQLEPDAAVAPEALAARLPPGTLLVGDAATTYAAVFAQRARILPFAAYHPSGALVARLGAERLAHGERDDVGTLEPVYVRPPEAELARLAGTGTSRT